MTQALRKIWTDEEFQKVIGLIRADLTRKLVSPTPVGIEEIAEARKDWEAFNRILTRLQNEMGAT